MADSVGRLTMEMLAKTANYEQGVQRAANKTKSAFKSMRDDLALLTGAFKAFAIGAVINQSLQYFNKIDVSLKKIEASTNSFRQNQEQLKQTALSVYKDIPVSIETASDAVITLANRTKLSGDAMATAARQAAQFAKITGTDVRQNIDQTVQSLNQWEISTNNIVEAQDLLFKISKQTGISVSQLNSELTDGADVLQTAGYSFRQSAIFLGQLYDQGIDATGVLKGMNSAIAELSAYRPKNLTEAFGRLTDLVKNAKTDTEALDIAVKAFGKKAGQDFVAIFRDGKVNIQQAREELEKITGINATETGTRSVLDKIGQTLRGYADSASATMATLDDSLTNLKPLVDGLVQVFAAIVVALGDAVKAFNNFVKTTITDNPYAKFLGDSAKTIGQNFGQIGQATAPGRGYYNAGNPEMVALAGYYNSQKQPAVQKAIDSVVQSTPALVAANNAISDSADKASASIAKQSSEMDKVKVSGDNTKKSYDLIADVQKELATKTDQFANTITDAFLAMMNGSMTAAEGIKSAVSAIIAEISRIIIYKGIAGPIANALTGFFGGGTTGDNPIKTSAIGTGHAMGGNVAAKNIYKVGENGPEWFMPGVSGAIIPNGAGVGNMTFSPVFNIQAGTPDAIKIASRQAMAELITQAPQVTAWQVGRGGRVSRGLRR